MDPGILKKLNDTAGEFVSIARTVSDLSRKRKEHSEEAMALIRQSLEIGDILKHEIDIITRANRKLREQDNAVLNSCIVLNSNLETQRGIVAKLRPVLSAEAGVLDGLITRIDELAGAIANILPVIQELIRMDNDIILMNNLINYRKIFQGEALQELQKLTVRTLEDADNAIQGSSSNLIRGQRICDGLSSITGDGGGGAAALLSIRDEARMGWNIATTVHRSSMSQLEFAEKVGHFTRRLHEDSSSIKDLVTAAYAAFTRYLGLVRKLGDLLSAEPRAYLETRTLIRDLRRAEGFPADIRDLLHNLVSYVLIACRDIETLSGMNYDMSESVKLNEDLEKKALDMSGMEMEYFDRIAEEVNRMTEHTKYPIEGSRTNIENGKLLESYIQEILSDEGIIPRNES